MTTIRRPRHRLAAALTALITAVALVPALTASAAPPDAPVEIRGGGWGHGVGMPQYGARGMAEEGHSHQDILEYFYSGAGVTGIEGTNGSDLPAKIRVGTNVVAGDEYRPFLWLDFWARNGDVEICLGGEPAGSCSYTAVAHPSAGDWTSPETWRIAWTGSGCTLTRNGSLQHGPGSCDIRLVWSNQPGTRVRFPELGRTFARGSVLFNGPVTYNGSTGFHIVVELTLQEYLYGLAEVPVSWHSEALEAQVVAARTFAAESTRRRIFAYGYNNGLRPDCSCHLVWTTWDQAYRGWHSLNEGNPTYGQRWKDAVDTTDGEVVVYPAGGSSMAETYYFSSSGGATENVWDVWGPDTEWYRTTYAYLASVPDPWSEQYASESTTIRWTKSTTAGAVASQLGFDSIGSVKITERRVSGSPSAIKVTGIVDGSHTTKTYTGNSFASKVGLLSHHIYSISGFAQPERLAGGDRYETAAAISKSTHPEGAAVVYLGVGHNFPDALAAGPAAAGEEAPILLVTSTGLPGATRKELQRLGPSKVVVLGGTAAVSNAVIAQVKDALPGVEVERRAGPSRYETAVEISKAVFASGVSTVYVTTGERFPDALVAAPAAVLSGSPLLLVRPDSVPAAVVAELQRLAPSKIVIVGGTAAVSNSVKASLGALAPQVQRISAADRYSMAANMSATTFDTAEVVYVAVGEDFPDALAAGPVSRAEPGPLLLVKKSSIPSAVASELARLTPSRIVILGGPAAVAEAVATQLAGYMG